MKSKTLPPIARQRMGAPNAAMPLSDRFAIKRLLPFLVLGFSVFSIAAENKPDDVIELMPAFKVEATVEGPEWQYATCDGIDFLSTESASDTRRFAIEFATFLRFVRKVSPELLLPEGTRLSVILANPKVFTTLVPLVPSPLGYAERPWGVIARSQDTAVMAVRLDAAPADSDQITWDGSLRDDAGRKTLINAQATYMNDPALVAHRAVLRAGAGPGTRFTTAVGEGRPFLASRQMFVKSGVLAIVAGLGSAVSYRYSFHDQKVRWTHYFPDRPIRGTDLDRTPLPIDGVPPLENIFAIDVDSPAWSSGIHRFERDALIHWALLANGPERARAFLDFLARAGSDAITPGQFAEAFGGSFADVTRALMRYADPRKSDQTSKLPAQNFWNVLPLEFPDLEQGYQSRAANPEVSSRIRADFLRLVGNSEMAARALAARFNRHQLDDQIWITAGLLLLDQHKTSDAARSFLAAIVAGTKRPVPYTKLADLKLRAAEVRHAGKKELTVAEVQPILDLLRESVARPPTLRENVELLCSLLDWEKDPPGEDFIDFVERTAKLMRYDTALLIRAASAIARKGEVARARRLLATARTGTFDTAALARVAAAEDELGESVPLLPPSVAIGPPHAREATPPTVQPENGERDFVIPTLNLKMVRIAPGEFHMGGLPSDPVFAPDQQPITDVTISRGFWMDQCEVTQRQWREVMGRTLRQQVALECADLPTNGEGDNLPIYGVSWHEAVEFCLRLTIAERKAGRISERFEYRLPIEAQWEYACRGGTTGPFAGDPGAIGWLPTYLISHAIPLNPQTFVAQVHAVGTKQPNAWRLDDMYGNVSEWCSDWYAAALAGGQVVDPQGPEDGSFRVVRGGSCWGFEVGVPVIGSAVRSRDLATARFGRGFRPVLIEDDAARGASD